MIISKTLAQTMINVIKDIIDKDLNFIDINGNIIASTDKERIGHLHSGALEVIKNSRDMYIVNDNDYPGSKKGINIPVLFQNKTIGVFGITGDPNEVSKYGLLLRRLTEILVNDAYLKDIAYKDRANQQLLIESILFFSYGSYEEHTTDVFNYDPSVSRRVVYGIFSSNNIIDDNQVFSYIKSSFNMNSNIILSLNNNMFVAFVNNSPKLYNLEDCLKALALQLQSNYSINARFTIGTVFSSKEEARHSFYRAKNLYNVTRNESQNSVLSYENETMSLLIASIEADSSDIFIRNIFHRMNKQEIEDFHKDFSAYEKANGSINKASAHLGIHKNTLQYRLNRLHQLSGYNPRELEDFTTLKMAFTLYEAKSSKAL